MKPRGSRFCQQWGRVKFRERVQESSRIRAKPADYKFSQHAQWCRLFTMRCNGYPVVLSATSNVSLPPDFIAHRACPSVQPDLSPLGLRKVSPGFLPYESGRRHHGQDEKAVATYRVPGKDQTPGTWKFYIDGNASRGPGYIWSKGLMSNSAGRFAQRGCSL